MKPTPAVNSSFREAASYLIEQPRGQDLSLLIDDERLEPAPGASSAWLWQPRFFAGEVTAELFRPDGRRVGLYRLDVSPDPAKTGREIFDRMIEEIWAEDPALVIGAEPSATQIGELGPHQDPLLELMRLRHYATAFLRAIDVVRLQPRRSLLARREFQPLYRARRVDRRTVRMACRSPGIAAYLSGQSVESLAYTSPLDVPFVEESLDCAANRCLLALTEAVARRARAVATALERQVTEESESETRTPLASRWAARRQFLERLIARIRAITREVPFSEVRRAEITAAGLNAVSADPLYARAWALGWRALRRGIAGQASDERLWISPTWEIYERWCFVRLGSLLRQACSQFMWFRILDHPTGAIAAWRGVGDGREIILLLQPTLPGEHPGAKHDLWSISSRRVPDILVTITSGDHRRFFVLDAKYRQRREAVVDAMASAHIYQDCLRLGNQRAQQTLLLIPAGGEASWLESPEFHAKHAVGVHVFAPGREVALPISLKEAIRG